MLAFINGILREKYEGIAVIECGGLGYELILTNSAFCNLPSEDEQVKLPTYLLVREDEWLIFGFSSVEEKNLFLQLITVSGVGAKTAIQILSGVKQSDLVNSIVSGDSHVIATVKGIGKKTAERIILELREKITTDTVDSGASVESVSVVEEDEVDKDAVIALMSLGFTKQECVKAVKAAKANGANTIEQVIAYSIKNIK